jgi:hypothetical protein
VSVKLAKKLNVPTGTAMALVIGFSAGAKLASSMQGLSSMSISWSVAMNRSTTRVSLQI